MSQRYKRHTINAGEIADFSFHKQIAASTDARGKRKEIVVFVDPSLSHMHFNVRHGDTLTLMYQRLGEAIEAYNDLP
jgi:hypothetical protein